MNTGMAKNCACASHTNSNRQRGFTLVELLVVIAIISVLAGLLLPALEDALESARRMACLNNQKQVYIAGANYAGDFDDRLPSGSYTAGGTKVSVSQLGWYSTRLLGAEYLSIPLAKYQWAPPHLGGCTWTPATDADLRTHSGNNIQFFGGDKIPDRGSYGCPSAVNDNLLYLDYWLVGFGGGYCYTNSPFSQPYEAGGREKYYHTRLSRVGEPVNGFRKLMMVDNTWSSPGGMGNGDIVFGYTCHNSEDPQGLNYIAADGAGGWSAENITVGGWSGSKMLPVGFYSLNYVCMWYPGDPNDPILYYSDENVARHGYRLTTSGQEADFRRWLGEWY